MMRRVSGGVESWRGYACMAMATEASPARAAWQLQLYMLQLSRAAAPLRMPCSRETPRYLQCICRKINL